MADLLPGVSGTDLLECPSFLRQAPLTGADLVAVAGIAIAGGWAAIVKARDYSPLPVMGSSPADAQPRSGHAGHHQPPGA